MQTARPAAAMVAEVRRHCRRRGQRSSRTSGAPTSLSAARSSFSGFIPQITGAPLLGAHTDEVLANLGYDADTIAWLRAENVVA
ncbi:hypothetical protein ACFVYA_21140 [Amycolatopsis sp. NPDC058278]|uniref:hypothetical protein n=1 Tax=Amycolatopsis sp. NPDC058278 TaxID=3346417 RepID=UPI0036DA5FF3